VRSFSDRNNPFRARGVNGGGKKEKAKKSCLSLLIHRSGMIAPGQRCVKAGKVAEKGDFRVG
jgi:hypothetical protein